MKPGKWKKLKTEEIYKCGNFYRIDKDKIITPGNNSGTYFTIRGSQKSVKIIPINKDGMIYLINQHRYPINKFSLEFPGGEPNKGETPLTAAKRELREEANLVSNRWEKLGEIYAAPGISDLKFFVFLARDVKKINGKSDDPMDKNLHETKKYSYSQMEKKINKGIIRAAPTIAGFTLYKLNKL